MSIYTVYVSCWLHWVHYLWKPVRVALVDAQLVVLSKLSGCFFRLAGFFNKRVSDCLSALIVPDEVFVFFWCLSHLAHSYIFDFLGLSACYSWHSLFFSQQFFIFLDQIIHRFLKFSIFSLVFLDFKFHLLHLSVHSKHVWFSRVAVCQLLLAQSWKTLRILFLIENDLLQHLIFLASSLKLLLVVDALNSLTGHFLTITFPLCLHVSDVEFECLILFAKHLVLLLHLMLIEELTVVLALDVDKCLL